MTRSLYIYIYTYIYIYIYIYIYAPGFEPPPRSLVSQQRRQRSLKHPPPPLWKCGMDVICSLPKRVHPPTPLWKCGVVFCAERRVRDVASRSGIKRRLCTCRRSMIIRKQPDLEKNLQASASAADPYKHLMI